MTTVGSGKYTYEMVENWAKLPEGENFAMVSAIATDSQDRVFAFQRKDPPILIFDRDGNLLDSWGNGAFSFAHGIYIEDDTVYLTDRDSSVCLVYTIDGKPIQMLGRHGVHSDTGCENPGDLCPRAAGPFNYPSELVPSPSGDLYVSDGYRNARIHRFSWDGQLKQSWGQPGKSEPGHFHLPHSLLIHNDKIFLCDRENHRMQLFTLDGEFHHHLERHPAAHGHLRGQRGRPVHQRGQRQRFFGPGQRPGRFRKRTGTLRLPRPRPRQLGRLPRRHLRRPQRRHWCRQVRSPRVARSEPVEPGNRTLGNTPAGAVRSGRCVTGTASSAAINAPFSQSWVRVRLLGEDLIAFCDTEERIGLVDE